MIIDSSVAAAICLGEPDAERFAEHLVDTSQRAMSAATYLEAGIVIDARMLGAFDRFVTNLDIDVIPVDLHQAGIARQAYRRFGQGSGHRAGLNFGDCFAYAAAIALDDTLLFKGTDFTYTDVRAAIE